MGTDMRISVKKTPLKIDYHTHILPGMDDGACDVEQANEMLQQLHAYGVQTVLLTPHYYTDNESPAAFLQRRKAAFEALNSAYAASSPRLILGAEVYLEKGLSKRTDLKKLCIGDSSYMLLEMPYLPLSEWMIEEIESLCFEHDCKLIFAHLLRYAAYYHEDDFAQLIDFPEAVVQVNAEDMLFRTVRKRVRQWIAQGRTVVFGTDCHNLDSRRPNFDVAEKHIAKICGGISPIEQADAFAFDRGWI